MSDLFYGVAYYDEYMPEDRLAKDIALMRKRALTWCGLPNRPGVRWSPGRRI
jgi:hypothetical protein